MKSDSVANHEYQINIFKQVGKATVEPARQ